MGLTKNSINTRPPPKKKLGSDYSITMGLGKNLIRLDPRQKKNLPTVLLWYMGNSIDTRSPSKTIYIFFSGYSNNAWNLKKSISLNDHRKKYICVSDYSTTVVHRT